MNERRAVVIAVIALLLLVGALVDRTGTGGGAATAAPLTPNPEARATNQASTWFCPIANSQAGQGADGTIVIANARSTAASGTYTLYPVSGAPATGPVHVGPHGHLTLHEQDILKTPAAGAVVELDQGGAAVEQNVAGALGDASAPCATRTASVWYVADGSTALNNAMVLGLFNPFPDDAIVDLDFATDQGHDAPGPFQGLVVPGRSLLPVNIGDHVRRRDHVAITIKARRGRLAVARIEYRTAPKPGLAFALATPALARTWDFPHGVAGDGASERISIYNPSSQPAVVQVSLTLDQGAAEPFEGIKVPADDRVTLDLTGESRVPKGVGHAVTVKSDTPVLAEQMIDYNTPTLQGLVRTVGAAVTAKQWLLAAGSANAERNEWVVVHNDSTRSTRVSLDMLVDGARSPIPGLQSVTIQRGARMVFPLNDLNQPALSVLVTSTSPVTVERVDARPGHPGVSIAVGVPLL